MDKLKKYSNFTVLLVLLSVGSSCSTKNQKELDAINNSFKYNIFNPFYIDKLVSPPLNYGSVCLSENIKKLAVNRINFVLRGGKNPTDVYEKQIYKFLNNGKLSENEFYFYAFSDKIMNQLNYHYQGANLDKIDVYKFFGVGNQPPIFVSQNERCEYYYKSKANRVNDTLFFYPNMERPDVIIEKIGNFINHMEIIVDRGSSASMFMQKIKNIDSSLVSFEIADKIITYTENKLPMESYHLGHNWNVMEMAKKWDYNKFNQPTVFKEWLHGTLIKDISIHYNENSLPKKYIVNKKKYTLIYSKT